MPTLPPTYEDGLILAAQRFTREGADHDCFITYAVKDDVGPGSEVAYANFLQDAFADQWKARLDTDVTIADCTIKIGDDTITPRLAVSDSATVNGTRSMSSEPANCNVLVQKRTALAGRKNRGRVYLPWMLSETDVDEVGGITSGTVTNLQTSATNWLDQVESGTGEYIIANHELAVNPDRPDRTYVVAYLIGPRVTSMRVDAKIASQRRRIGR